MCMCVCVLDSLLTVSINRALCVPNVLAEYLGSNLHSILIVTRMTFDLSSMPQRQFDIRMLDVLRPLSITKYAKWREEHA